MTEIFISYASEDRDRAAQLANALGALGWSVWWGRKIVTGQAFDRAIERELENAKCVIVLWSTHSIESEWVKNEAAVASERGVLLPATIERVKLPLEFRRKQTADLVDWEGEHSHSGFQALCEGVTHTMGGNPLPQATPPQSQEFRWNPRWALAAIATIVVAVGLGVYLIGPWQSMTPTPLPQSDRPVALAPSESKKPPGAVQDTPSTPQSDRPVTSTPSESKKPPGTVRNTTPTPQSGRPVVRAPSESEKPLSAVMGLADLVVGTYSGSVVWDTKGPSRSDIDVTVTKLDRYTVRVTSDYQRIVPTDITLSRYGNMLQNAGGNTLFGVDLDKDPLPLSLATYGEGAFGYGGTRRN